MNILDLRANVLWDKYSPLNSGLKDDFFSSIQLPSFPSWSFTFSIFSLGILLLLFRLVFRVKKTLQEPLVLLELTPPATTEKTAYTTQQLFSVIHNLGKQKSWVDKLIGKKTTFSFEIASTKQQGIRYLIRTSSRQVNNLKHHVLSYLPQVNAKIVNEYLPENNNLKNYHSKIIEFKQSKHYAYPLEKQNSLDEHDPVAYITGMMTKLSPGELISLQIVLSPTQPRQKQIIKNMIFRGEDLLSYLDKRVLPSYLGVFSRVFWTIKVLIGGILSTFAWSIKTVVNDAADPYMARRQSQTQYQMQYMMNTMAKANLRPARIVTPSEEKAIQSVEQKMDQQLFQAKMRLFMLVKDKDDLKDRERGFMSSLAVYSGENDQTLARQLNLNAAFVRKYLLFNFKKKLLSFVFNSSPTLLSTSEVSDLYHFPYTRVTQTENIVKVYSRELPAPLSLKQGKKLSVVFGKNNYGGTETLIGQTEEERTTHTYFIGRTGSGKTTAMFAMAKHDIENGEGIAFIDPHGDVSEDLLASIPESRKNDFVYINPIDLQHPIGINVLELTPGLDEDEAELEKEVVAEGVVSLFRVIFSKDENVNAHRIEYILRNTIYTAFTLPERTIFTLYNILNNPKFRKQVIKGLDDEDLINFWKYEFGKAGDYQVVKMVGGVTAKIGRFLRSPTAKRILEQEKSTINFDEILNGKILLCNLSQGKLGEDTARLLGTTILTKLQQAALKRANIPQKNRKPFYLYVDEFQNFATKSFTKMLSEARKYSLRLIIAEQSTSQQLDGSIVNIILTNVTTIICFRTGNPIDEDLMLAQFAPHLKKGEIANLSRYKFYIKISAIESQEPFSGETIKFTVRRDPKKIARLIKASQDNNAIVYIRPPKKEKNVEEESTDSETKVEGKAGLPKPRKV